MRRKWYTSCLVKREVRKRDRVTPSMRPSTLTQNEPRCRVTTNPFIHSFVQIDSTRYFLDSQFFFPSPSVNSDIQCPSQSSIQSYSSNTVPSATEPIKPGYNTYSKDIIRPFKFLNHLRLRLSHFHLLLLLLNILQTPFPSLLS